MHFLFQNFDVLFYHFLYQQMYLQSTTVRLEEWRIRRTDTEQWMCHRQLPNDLKQSVRRYDQYSWVATRGVDEEAILKGLPTDLRRDIKRHLCLDLVRQVSFLVSSLFSINKSIL
jgi:cyclic nucleotide gated channel